MGSPSESIYGESSVSAFGQRHTSKRSISNSEVELATSETDLGGGELVQIWHFSSWQILDKENNDKIKKALPEIDEVSELQGKLDKARVNGLHVYGPL